MGAFEKIVVKCDEPGCLFKQETKDIKQWVNKKCPICFKGIIITKAEWRLFKFIRLLLLFDSLIARLPWMKGKERKYMTVNTVPMREGKPPEVKKDGDEGDQG